MIEFILLALVLVAITLWIIAPTLFADNSDINFSDSSAFNINIAKEKLLEINTQLKAGIIDQAQYEQIKNEIESSLLDDTRAENALKPTFELSAHYKRNVLILLALIPFSALGLYQLWGTPDAINLAANAKAMPAQAKHQSQTASPESPHNNPQDKMGDLSDAMAKLEARLAKTPNDPDGWYMLARSYAFQKQYSKSVVAFRKLQGIVGDDPVVLLGLADTLTMSRNGNMSGEPFELAKKALAIEPNNPTALWLSGLGYQDVGDITTALKLWQQLLPLVAEDNRSSHEVQALITTAQQQLGLAPKQAVATAMKTGGTSPASLSIKVELDPNLTSKVSDTDYVMIYAQRVVGMRMPLAIIKAQVKDLPMTVILDDSKSAGPMGKLSDVETVNVIARISKTGQAVKQASDIEAKLGPYPVSGADTISITIK